MNFEIEIWEVPPGADANNLSVPIEFGPIDWNGEMAMISARWLELDSGEALAFFRPHESGINFVVTSERGLLYQRHKRINSKTLGERARFGMEKREFRCGRLFYCGGEGLLIAGTQAHWIGQQNFWQMEAPLTVAFDSQTEPSASAFDWIQKQWANPNSEIRISWEWNRKNERQREDWLGTIVPRWSELHDLMRAVSCVAELPVGQHWILDHVDTHNHAPALLERLRPWRELLEAQFWFEPLPEFYPQFLREYFRCASGHIQVEGVEFSAHEQLEAKLYLRDWLQQNAPTHLHLVH